MNSDIKITIVIPAYNVAEWLPRCIESVLQQTYSNLEVLIINDGSTDETASIIEDFARKDTRVVAANQENAGLIAVREKGIAMATGQYVGFVDGDDEVEPDMFERLLNNALKYNADISQCGILYCFYDGRKKPMHGTKNVYVFDRKEGYRELMQGTRMEPSLCNKLYKRELLVDSCPDKSVINNEDLLRNSVLFSRAERSVFEDFCGYHYWRRAESMSNNARVAQNGLNILKARKLIVDRATPDVREFAFASYLSAIISTYNSLIGSAVFEAVKLRKDCKDILCSKRAEFYVMNKGMRGRAYAIMYCSIIYDLMYKIHMQIKYAKIHRKAKRLSENV